MKAALPLLAALLLAATPAVQAQSLGRLFLTPQQRQALDRLRLQAPDENFQQNRVLNGEVRRSGGATTRWINGRADWTGAEPAPRVPVGDSFDPASGAHQPLLGGGRITIKRPPSPP